MAYEYRAIIDGVEYFSANSEVYSCVSENSTMGSRFEIGNVISGRLDISVVPKSVPSEMASVTFYMRLSGSVRLYDSLGRALFDSLGRALYAPLDKWHKRGEYFIAKRNSDKDNRRLDLECYDILRSFTEPFHISGLQPDWPMSMSEALNTIAAATNIRIDPRTFINPSYMLEYPNERSIREVLRDIASAHAGNFIMTNEGELLLVKAYQIGKVHDIGLSAFGYADNNKPQTISRVTMAWDDGENDYFTAGDDSGYEVVVENPNATQQIVNDVYTKLRGFTHVPFEVDKAIISPLFEFGDGIIIAGNSSVINGYRTHYSATILSDVYNPSDDEINDEFAFRGDVENALRRRIKEGSNYEGVSITRRNGLVITNEYYDASLTLNTRLMDWNVGGQRVLYVDAIGDVPSLVFNGAFSTSVAGKITNEIDGTVSEAKSEINQRIDSIRLSVTNGYSSSEVALTVGGVQISSQSINMSGLVTFTNIGTAGQTTINGGNITTGTINANNADVENMDASQLTRGTIPVGRIAPILGSQIAASTITSHNLGVASVTEDAIGSGAVTSSKIPVGAINGGHISSGIIANNHISSSAAISYSKLSFSKGYVPDPGYSPTLDSLGASISAIITTLRANGIIS